MRFENIDKGVLASPVADEPLVSYQGMYDSAFILYDMAAYLMPFHGLDSRDIFSYCPVLGFVAALVGQAEEDIQNPRSGALKWPAAWRHRERAILELLKAQGLDCPPVLRRLEQVGEHFERIQAVIVGAEINHHVAVSLAEGLAVNLRLIHALIAQLLGKDHDDEFNRVMWPLEVFGYLNEYAGRYEDDRALERFNVYGLFVKLYGERGPEVVQTELDRYLALFAERLSRVPEEKRNAIQAMIQHHNEDNPDIFIPMPER